MNDRAPAGPEALQGAGSPVVFRLSITRTILFPGKRLSAMSFRIPAKPFRVRRPVTPAWRR